MNTSGQRPMMPKQVKGAPAPHGMVDAAQNAQQETVKRHLKNAPLVHDSGSVGITDAHRQVMPSPADGQPEPDADDGY